jgi:hypothetical protein
MNNVATSLAQILTQQSMLYDVESSAVRSQRATVWAARNLDICGLHTGVIDNAVIRSEITAVGTRKLESTERSDAEQYRRTIATGCYTKQPTLGGELKSLC